MPDFVYPPSPVLVETTGNFAIGATGVLRATEDGAAVQVWDLNDSPLASVVVGPKGAHQAFKADIAHGILDFGSVKLPAISLEAQVAGITAQQVADEASATATEAATSAAAAQSAAQASAVSAAQSAAVAAAAGGGGGGGGSAGLQTASYYIWKELGGNVKAAARVGSGLPAITDGTISAVLQACVNALTVPGGRGTSGGRIHIARTFGSDTYFLNNEVTITGWEGITGTSGIPESQLVITGDGATTLVQNTAGQNGIVVKNAASVKITDLRIFAGTNAKSCILGDNNGAQSEMSLCRATLDNLYLSSTSTTSPALYLKNFFDISAPSIHAIATANHGVVLENDSATTNYGNSNFGFLRTVASASAPYAGLVTRSTNATHFLNLLTFANFECLAGYYGLYAKGLYFSSFGFVDIEGLAKPIYFDGDGTGIETRHNKILAGYIYPAGTAITCVLQTGGNSFSAYIEAGTYVPVLDQQQYRPRNRYDLALGNQAQVDRIQVTDTVHTEITAALTDGSVVRLDNSGA